MAGYSVTYTVVDNATKQIDAINRRITQMRAPMDRLSRQVSRFVDVSGLRKVATGFEWIGKAASTVLRTLTAIVPVMGAITGAASIAGLAKLVSLYADWSRELVANADSIGTTTQALQQFQDATRLAGGNASDMTESLKGLHDTLGNINIGSGNAATALQWFNKLGINIRDANGHIRNTTDMMPELIQKLADIKDPLDRARAANELLGASGDKLVETFRQSSQSFSQWFTDVSRYKDLTDEQKRSLQQFSEAQGRVGVAFDRLGQQISVVVARDFGPLLTHFSQFVEKHTPEIVAAVDRISRRFADWLENVDWSKVEDGVNSLLDGLKWVINNLDTVKDVAEAIAVVFATKWALGIVADIAKVVTALGTVGGGGLGAAAGGAGLLGALASVAAIAGVLAQHGSTAPLSPEDQAKLNERNRQEEEDYRRQHGGAAPNAAEINKKYGYTGSFFSDLGLAVQKGFEAAWDRIMQGPESIRPGYQPQSATGGYLPGGVTPATYNTPVQPAGRAVPLPDIPENAALPRNRAGAIDPGYLRDLVAKTLNTSQENAAAVVSSMIAESGGRPTAVQGEGAYVEGSTAREQESGLDLGLMQMHGPRRRELIELAHRMGIDPRSLRAQMAHIASEMNTPAGRHTLAEMDAAKTLQEKAMIWYRDREAGGTSSGNWTPREVQRHTQYAPGVLAAPAAPAAPPVAVPPQPVNGAVDVSITHKNPPPNSAVTATGSGSVNVAPVRVEHQNMADI